MRPVFQPRRLIPSGTRAMGYYDTAQVCLNGHLINDNFRGNPVHNKKHCDKCGEATITQCPSCNTPIRGEYEVEGVFAVGGSGPVPNFCHECGKSYPWTERGLQAAKELADEFEGLAPTEREELKKSLDELVKNSPKAEVAGFRFKKLMKKEGAGSVEVMKTVISDLLSETVKKSVFGV